MKIEMSGLARVGVSGFVDVWTKVEDSGDALRMRREG
jgi:hypothetical protein